MMVRTPSQVGKSNVDTAKTHERRIARILTEWSGEEYRRRRVEGRDATTMIRDATGDVVPVNKRCRFNIEAKKGKNFSIDAILNVETVHTTLFTSWWHQSTYDAKLYSDLVGEDILPLVIFKPIPAWDWVAFPVESLKYIKPKDSDEIRSEIWFPAILVNSYDYCGPVSCNVKHTSKKENKVFVPLQLRSCFITRWKTFSEAVNPLSFFL